MSDPAQAPDGVVSTPRFRPVTVDLPDGERLLVRELGPGDRHAVEALYDGLEAEDRRLRFFSSFPPSPAFVTRWLDPSRGLVLGAFVRPAGASPAAPGPGSSRSGDGDGRLVAEAGYARLPNGNGELGITTAADWRGWLGPFLLDMLASAAGENGIENLEADIRLENRAMLGLVRHRGAAVVDQPAQGQVRLVMATGAATPGWPPHRDPARLRVLVEAPSGRWTAPAGAVVPASLEILTCAGPHGRAGGRCPLLDGGHCPLVDGADRVVVVTEPRAGSSFAALADAHRERGGGPDGTQELHLCGAAAGVAELLGRLAERPQGPEAAADTADTADGLGGGGGSRPDDGSA